ELSKDVNLAGMEGKARLAERAKPLLAGIPDGAFRDLMQQRLTEITGVGQRAAPTATAAATPSMRGGRSGAPAPKVSLVRAAISLLLQQPDLAQSIEPPYLFGILRQPGIALLMELIELARERPGIGTGAILEHFAERDEGAALQKLAMQVFPGEPAAWRAEFLDALAQLDRQTRQQRIDELQARINEVGMSGLGDAEKAELRELHAGPR
nr:DNA primase [Arenimonas sp.]